MKFPILAAAMLVLSSAAYADFPPDGYYRIKNQKTQRYIVMNDNHGSIDYTAGDADFGALATWHDFDRVASYPGSIIYVTNVKGASQDNYFMLACQGTSTQEIVGHNLQLKAVGDGSYLAYASLNRFTKYLSDGGAEKSRRTGELLDGYFSTSVTDLTNSLTHWVPAMLNTTDNYMGLQPKKYGDQYWAEFFAVFPYNFASEGMSAWVVTKVDKQKAMAVIEPVHGDVPGAAPVIVKCSTEGAVNNKLNLLPPATGNVVGNMLKGVYFCNDALETSGHRNVVNFNPSTMRVLGQLSDGSLGYVASSDQQYISYNSSYLPVDADCPAELKVVTKEEYEASFVTLTVQAKNATREYGAANPTFEYTVAGGTLEGTPELSCDATATSPVGTYPIKITKGTVSNTNNVVYEDGVLTITPASLTVTPVNAERYVGEANPTFELRYEGFKNGETEAVVTTKPTVTTTATAESPAGTYDITVSGGEAQNYTLSYVIGKLTVKERPVTITAKNLTRVYGEANPTFEYTVAGGTLEGTPELSCEATATSPVGTYAIKVAKGSVTNTSVTYVDGVLTVTAAPLTVTALDATRVEGEQNPVFELKYEGFKNGETDAVFTVKPTAATTATAESAAGEYAITVSGGQAKNYTLTYVSGKLVVTEKEQPIIIVETTPDERDVNGTPATYAVDGGEAVYIAPVAAPGGQATVTEVEIPKQIVVKNEAGEETTYTVKEIAENAFKGNDVLTSISIPETVEMIGDQAFAGCTSLMEIFVFSSEPIDLTQSAAARMQRAEEDVQVEAEASGVFTGVNFDECKLYVPFGSKAKYEQAEVWKMFKNIIEMADPSGINELQSNIDRANTKVYNMSGMRVTTLRKGLYIVGGRKVVVK